MKLFESCNSIIELLMNVPAMKEELINNGYTEEEAESKIDEMHPEINAYLEHTKSLISKLERK